MNYRILPHARQQMQQREVSADIIRQILDNPGQIVDGDQGRKIYQSIINLSDGGRLAKPFLVRVVVNPDVDPALVVTVIATTQISKYWSQS